MKVTLKGIFKSLKLLAKKLVVKEKEIEIGHPTDVLHVAHVGYSSESGPSWMNAYKRAPNFSKSFGILGEPTDSRSEAETSSRSSQGSRPSEESPQVPKKLKQKKIRSLTRKSKSKPLNEREVTAVAEV